MVGKLPVLIEVTLASCCGAGGVKGRSGMINDGFFYSDWFYNDACQSANDY
jgi:hypothetical protein